MRWRMTGSPARPSARASEITLGDGGGREEGRRTAPARPGSATISPTSGRAGRPGAGGGGAGPAGAAAEECGALVAEGRQGDGPAVVEPADQVGVIDAGVGEEDLVEMGFAVHLADGPDLDPGLVGVDEEVARALVLGLVDIGAGDEQAPVGVHGPDAPDLLPVHDPLVAVAHGPGVGPARSEPASRLAEELAPRLLTGDDRGQETAGFCSLGRQRPAAPGRPWTGRCRPGGPITRRPRPSRRRRPRRPRRRQAPPEPLLGQVGKPHRARPGAVHHSRTVRSGRPVGGQPGPDLPAHVRKGGVLQQDHARGGFWCRPGRRRRRCRPGRCRRRCRPPLLSVPIVAGESTGSPGPGLLRDAQPRGPARPAPRRAAADGAARPTRR